MTRPNIVYVHSHDSGRYVQPYGHALPTPNIQRLAEEGVLFRKAFCAQPTCSPSRAALLTGQYPHNNGMFGLAHRGWSLNDMNHHIIHTLRKAGYHSALCGVQHVSKPDVGAIGYHEIITLDGNALTGGPTAGEWIKKAPTDQPFFLSVGFGQTHRHFPEPDPQDDERYCMPPAPLPDTPRTRYDMASYKSLVRKFDTGVGAVLDAINEAGLADNTLVICTTDHGIAFPAMKCNLTDHGTGVMLIVRGPGGFTGGKVIDGMVQHMDLFPTICDLLEIDRPDWLQGKSVLPLIHGGPGEIHDEIFTELTYHATYEPQRAVRTPRWKYVRRFDDEPRVHRPNCDASPSKDVWLEHGWADRNVDREQLYDLIFDPNEACNRAEDPDCAEVLTDLRNRLDRWMEQTDDPLRNGPIPVPAGGKVNSPDQLHPSDPGVE